MIYSEWNPTILFICSRLFCHVDYVFLVTLIFSFSSCRFCIYRLVNFREFLWLIFSCLFHELSWIVLVLNYQLHGSHWLLYATNRLLIPAAEATSSTNWPLVRLTIILATIVFNLTLYRIDRILPNEKNVTLIFIRPVLYDFMIF